MKRAFCQRPAAADPAHAQQQAAADVSRCGPRSPKACPREGEFEGREGGLSAASLMSWPHVSEEVTVFCKTSIWQAVQVSIAIGLVVLVLPVECGFCIGTLDRVN